MIEFLFIKLLFGDTKHILIHKGATKKRSKCSKLETLAYKHITNQFSIVRKLIKKEVAT